MSSDVMVAVVEERNAVNSGSVEMDVLSVYSGTSSSHAEWRSISLRIDVTSWWDLYTDPDAGIVTEFYHWRIRAVNGYEVPWRMFALYPELF